MSNIDRAVEVIRPLVIARNLTFTERAKRIVRALADARLLRPDLPKPGSGGEWADTRPGTALTAARSGT